MKKQITAILASALILGSLTACSNGSAATIKDQSSQLSDNKSSVTSNPGSEASSADDKDSTPQSETEKSVIGVYGETEIPDIPCGNAESGGRASDIDDKEVLESCLDSMVFEKHTFEEYTVKLVGDTVRTDKANFPDKIYTHDLRVEVEKNGAAIEGSGGYGDVFLLGSQFCTEYILFADKIGSYLDVYDLEIPVIAMRYFFDKASGDKVTKAVEFATIRDGKLGSGYLGTFAKGTGVVSPSSAVGEANELLMNTEDGAVWRAGVFAADEFKIADNKTLVDEEAGIRYIFDLLSDPYQTEGRLYVTERIN